MSLSIIKNIVGKQVSFERNVIYQRLILDKPRPVTVVVHNLKRLVICHALSDVKGRDKCAKFVIEAEVVHSGTTREFQDHFVDFLIFERQAEIVQGILHLHKLIADFMVFSQEPRIFEFPVNISSLALLHFKTKL